MFSIFSPHSTTTDISYIDFLPKFSYSSFNKHLLITTPGNVEVNMSEITLDNRSFSLLEYIYNNPYISYASLKTTFPSYNDIEDLVLSFDEQHLISLREASSLEADTDQYETYNLVDSSGNAIIEQAKRRTDEFNTKLKPLYDIADKTTSLAESASIRADLAKEQADSARKTSISAKFKANLSFILSVITAICSLLANADKIVHNVQKILSYLGLQ